MNEYTKTTVTEEEEVLADVVANHCKGVEARGGRLRITSLSVSFKPHTFNVQSSGVSIPLDEIREVGKRNTLGFIPNGMFIRTNDGVEHKFVVWGRGKLIGILNSLLR